MKYSALFLVCALAAACNETQPKSETMTDKAATTSAAEPMEPMAEGSAEEPAAAKAPEMPMSPPGDYTVDLSHSRLGFSIRHMLVSNTNGEFRKFSGTAHIDQKDLSKTKIELEIDPASIDTRDEKRDGHLKNKDFFDVEKFTKMSFVSTSVEQKDGGYDLVGDLEMHGVKKPVTLHVEELTADSKGPDGVVRRGAKVTGTLNRRDFGIEYGTAAAIGDEVKLDLAVELIRKADDADSDKGDAKEE